MPVVAILNPKGGTGKSTLAVNIATALHRRDPVGGATIVDTDAPQHTAWEWHQTGGDAEDATEEELRGYGEVLSGDMQKRYVDAQRRPIVLTTGSIDELERNLDALKGPGVVVIDGAGQIEGMTGAAVRLSDVVLIPVRPSAADLWSVRDLMEPLQRRREQTGGTPKGAFIISQAVTGANVSDQVAEALEVFELPIFETRTGQRVAYAETMAEGKTVLDRGSSKAAAEIEGITDELQTLLNQ